MRNDLLVKRLLLVFVISGQSSLSPVNASMYVRPEAADVLPGTVNSDVHVSLRTPNDSTIMFQQDGQSHEAVAQPTVSYLPHLTLKRNGALTQDLERTLLVTVSGVSVPQSGVFADLAIETQHSDLDLGEESSNRIEIIHERRYLPYIDELTQSVDFTIEFQQTLVSGEGSIQTPTDYYAYHLSLTNAEGETLREIHQEYAFLLENQWVVPLPEVLEYSEGAAPDRLTVYYCDMFSFQRDPRDAATRLKRHEVEPYIQHELLPAMVQAFQVQSNVWNMPWYEEWRNYRTQEDPESLSVALAEYPTWYHGPAPTLGYESMSIRVNGSYGAYANLTDGIMSVFHHELFHNQQRNISLHFRGQGHLSGKDDAWQVFSEGTAVLASAVGQPDVEFEPVIQPRSYVKRVRGFLGQDGFIGGGLNESYTKNPYHTALYWRFLYERCGGLNDGNDTPGTGMAVMRNILETLYQGQVVDIDSSSDVVSALPAIVDIALQSSPACEFSTYEESVLAFSEAIFRLRVQNGGSSLHGQHQGGEFFDPDHLYPVPNAEKLSIEVENGDVVQGSIPSSYGVDLMEIDLGTEAKNRSLELTLASADGTQEEFCIQVWQIHAPHNVADTDGAAILLDDPGLVCTDDGRATLEIAPVDAGTVNDLGIAITRMDAHEAADTGNYMLSIHRR